MSEEEFAATFPPAPCGQQVMHVQWVELEGWACPACAAKEKRRQKDRDRDLLAEAIAEKVAAKMAERQE